MDSGKSLSQELNLLTELASQTILDERNLDQSNKEITRNTCEVEFAKLVIFFQKLQSDLGGLSEKYKTQNTPLSPSTAKTFARSRPCNPSYWGV